MKIQASIRRIPKAYVLLLTLTFLGVILIVVPYIMSWAGANAMNTIRNNQYIASQYAAEAAMETIYSKMYNDYSLQGFATNGSVYAAVVPGTADWPVQYQFSNSVSIGQSSTNMVSLDSPYDGLYAQLTPAQITCTATPIGQRYDVPATVSQTIQLASIPLFQFVIFYNLNLEMAPGAPMAVNGRVFSNAGLWSGSSSLTFNSTVWAVGQVANAATDPYSTHGGSGASTYTLAGQPVSGVKSLTIPIAGTNASPTLVESLLQWPPSAFGLGTAAAYGTNGQWYFANAADIIISNSAAGINGNLGTNALPVTNTFAYYQDNRMSGTSSIVPIPFDYYILKTGGTTNFVSTNLAAGENSITNVRYAGYTFLTNVLFYDWREAWNNGNGVGGKGKTVQALQLDVNAFNVWLNNTNLNGTTNLNGGAFYKFTCITNKGHVPTGIYIYTSVQPSTSVLPAVRIVNGAKLYDSHGMGIATPMPMYIKGDFNVTDDSGVSNAGQNITTHTHPAAFYADSITILSSSFADSNAKRPPASSATTINAACIEGIVQSDPSIIASDDSGYSGGVENFLRLLESWGSSRTLYYNGSINVLFPSVYSTNRWRQTGRYYDAPNRQWNFDTNYLQAVNLPPLTPRIYTILRQNWSR